MKNNIKWLAFLILFQVANTFAARVDTFLVESKSMHVTISNWVILPDSHVISSKNFPVLYLLHGAFGTHQDWLTKVPTLRTYADAYQMIIVCSDGGDNSWYFDSPVDPQMRYETYISLELVAAIDQQYQTRAVRTSRAITGLSMGGHGAFYLAFRHQKIWGAAGSMSGGLDLRPFPTSWDIPKRLGEYASHSENWEAHTVINMVQMLNGDHLKLTFDCGVDDFFYKVNQQFHQKLLELNIPHDYAERPGSHDWDYWANAIKYQLVFFDGYFRGNE